MRITIWRRLRVQRERSFFVRMFVSVSFILTDTLTLSSFLAPLSPPKHSPGAVLLSIPYTPLPPSGFTCPNLHATPLSLKMTKIHCEDNRDHKHNGIRQARITGTRTTYCKDPSTSCLHLWSSSFTASVLLFYCFFSQFSLLQPLSCTACTFSLPMSLFSTASSSTPVSPSSQYELNSI
ncbi:hypothetical protein C8R42DRAFT_390639 [Lentinula raphanica]|nr:hypothetical protein C8R42DRAFT_390639 [Lentinula raphanica]